MAPPPAEPVREARRLAIVAAPSRPYRSDHGIPERRAKQRAARLLSIEETANVSPSADQEEALMRRLLLATVALATLAVRAEAAPPYPQGALRLTWDTGTYRFAGRGGDIWPVTAGPGGRL